MRPRVLVLAVLPAIGFAIRIEASPGVYLSTEAFLDTVFVDATAEPARLVLNTTLRGEIEGVLGHAFPRLRLRYWRHGETTAWILDEIGKTEPITIGVAVESGRIASVRVLRFRESRGWEVRYPFFTDQFEGAALSSTFHLDRSVDGITGATLSVNAVEKISRVALLLDRHVRQSREPKAPAS